MNAHRWPHREIIASGRGWWLYGRWVDPPAPHRPDNPTVHKVQK